MKDELSFTMEEIEKALEQYRPDVDYLKVLVRGLELRSGDSCSEEVKGGLYMKHE